MVHSRMPVLSLLGLFSAFLMLSPEFPGVFPVEIPGDFHSAPFTDAGVQNAIAFSVELYNRLRDPHPNYFKQGEVVTSRSKIHTNNRYNYILILRLVETTCIKTAGETMNYQQFQTCSVRPDNPERPLCFFRMRPGSVPNEMYMTNIYCE